MTEYSEIHRSEGERIARDPWYWHFKAKSFYYAADLLWQQYKTANDSPSNYTDFREISLFEPCCFLYAVTIENLLKAFILEKNPDAVINNKFYVHDLIKLSEIANVSNGFNDNEKKILQHLTSWLYWKGRFPVPKWNSENSIKSQWDIPYTENESGEIFIDTTQAPGAIGPKDQLVIIQIIKKFSPTIDLPIEMNK